MTPPRFSPRLFRLFALWLRGYFRRNFDAVRLATSGPLPGADDGPLIVVANHPSWWDPITFMLLADQCFRGRESYGPMDAEALERYGILRRLGVFGVEKDSRRGAATFLRTGRRVLERPGAILWVTAQGEFRDPRDRPLRLQPGVTHLVRRVDGVTVLPLALEYPFWNERAPEVLARFGSPLTWSSRDLREREAVHARIVDALTATMDALARDAARREPDAFATLLLGRSGVGGAYELGRRLRAWATGRRYRPEHDPERRAGAVGRPEGAS